MVYIELMDRAQLLCQSYPSSTKMGPAMRKRVRNAKPEFQQLMDGMDFHREKPKLVAAKIGQNA